MLVKIVDDDFNINAFYERFTFESLNQEMCWRNFNCAEFVWQKKQFFMKHHKKILQSRISLQITAVSKFYCKSI